MKQQKQLQHRSNFKNLLCRRQFELHRLQNRKSYYKILLSHLTVFPTSFYSVEMVYV